ncbi:MAG: PAS domain S-box protein [Nitrospirae bacterium]|nr:PAS domain S-box protein [Nitrospirota bacterium]
MKDSTIHSGSKTNLPSSGTRLILKIPAIDNLSYELNSTLVGIEPSKCIIVSISGNASEFGKLKGLSVSATYLFHGIRYTFKSIITDVISNQFSLLIIDYPKSIEQISIRSNERIDCLLPVAIKVEEHEGIGTLINISKDGCKLMIKTLHDRNSDLIERFIMKDSDLIDKFLLKDKSINLQFALLDKTDKITVDGFIINLYKEGFQTSYGIKFINLNDNIIQSLDNYIDNLKKIERSDYFHNIISEILIISIEDISFQEQLERIFSLIIHLPYLSVQPKGTIHLVENEPEVLRLKVSNGIQSELVQLCDRVPFGRCLCGLAASTAQPVTSECIDNRHYIRFDDMMDHGHYCMPIILDKKVLGVLNLYLDVGYHLEQNEQDFLLSVANILAGIIIRKQSKDRLSRLIGELQNTLEELVNKQQQLNQSYRYSQSLIDCSMDMIISTDKDGNIVEFNQSAQNNFQYRREEVIGLPISYLFDPIEDSINVFDETIKRKAYSTESLNQRKDGSQFVSALSFSVLTNSEGETLGMVGVIRDITEQKMFAQRQTLLIDELSETNDELQKSQERLVQSEKMASLGQLVAGVAHEINTPIGIAITSASRLVTLTNLIQAAIDNKNMKKSEFEQYLKDNVQGNDLILRNLNRTADLIRSFKMVSADQTSQEIRKFNLKSYIHDIILSLRPKLKMTKHVIEIHCPDNIELKSNPGAFAQIITNLIMNSLIHAFEVGDIGHIDITCENISGHLILRYNDNGKGVPEEHLKKIFDPFFTTKRGSGGTGLGLNIVFNIVNKNLLGTIRCESVVGVGTTFIMELPINI